MFTRHLRVWITLIAAALMLCAVPAYAQDGKLKIHVMPKQAYLFVDGKAINDGNHTISLPAGKHTIAVVNYGYKISTQDINIDAGKTTNVDVKLEAYGGNVAGPWGRIQFHGAERSAVLLEGKTPDYFVGHVDEFNWDWIWKQELLVPPGAHNITVTRNGTDVWSGTVNVAANQKVVIDLSKQGAQKTVPWPRGEQLMKKSPLVRFKAGIASATVVVAPVTIGGFTASTTQINCGQSSTLNWSANDAVRGNISTVGDVQPTGSQSVTPHATTTYTLTVDWSWRSRDFVIHCEREYGGCGDFGRESELKCTTARSATR